MQPKRAGFHIARPIAVAVMTWFIAQAVPCLAEEVSLKDKTVAIVVGFTPGGPSDVLARAVADGFSKRLPRRPSVIVRNMPGVEGVTALNFAVTQAKPDGLTVMLGAAGNFDPLLNRDSHAAYDPAVLSYIGAISATPSVLLGSKAAAARLPDKGAAPVIMGASNNVRATMWGVALGSALLGWNVKWVFGYPGTGDLQLALSKGEIDMTTMSDRTFIQNALNSGNFAIVFRAGEPANGSSSQGSDLDGPTFSDLTKGKQFEPVAREALAYWSELTQVGTWLALAPGTPEPVVAEYRKAFVEMASDPEFITRIKISFPDFSAIAADDLARSARNLSSTSPRALAYMESLRDSLRK